MNFFEKKNKKSSKHIIIPVVVVFSRDQLISFFNIAQFPVQNTDHAVKLLNQCARKTPVLLNLINISSINDISNFQTNGSKQPSLQNTIDLVQTRLN